MGAQSGDSRPVLWQIAISHYSEKVRWALDWKGIPHVRHSLVPLFHERFFVLHKPSVRGLRTSLVPPPVRYADVWLET